MVIPGPASTFSTLFSTVLCAAALLCSVTPAHAFHGGQYQPPPGAEGTALEGVVSQPGLGPVLAFDAERWEWWFDFNQEALIDLRRRLPGRAAAAGGRFDPVTDDDRQALLPTLVGALRHRHRDVRAAAVMALGRMGLAEGVAAVELTAETDRDLFVRTQAVLALGFSGQARALEVLQRLYADEGEADEVRTYAAVALGLLGDARSVDILFEALDPKRLAKQSNTLRAATVYAAGLPTSVRLCARLLDLRGTRIYKSEAYLRALVAVAWGQTADRQWLAPLLELLHDDHNQVRRSAAMGLEAMSPALVDADVAGLVEAYQDDSDIAVRLGLLRALGRTRAPASHRFLLDLDGDIPYLLRTHYVLALGFDGDPDNASLLLEILDDEREESIRGAAAVGLGLLEAPSAADPLRELLEEGGSPLQRGYVCLALGLVGSAQPGVGALLEERARKDHDVEVVRLAILGLGLLGERARVDGLAADADEVEGVIDRASRLYGLGLVGDRNVLPALVSAFDRREELSYVKAYALQAIAEVCDPRPLPPTWRLSRHVDLSHDVGFLFELYRTL